MQEDTLIWLKEEIWPKRQDLWKRIYLFNWDLPSFAHPGRVAQWLSADVFAACDADKRAYPLLCKGILEQLDIPEAFEFDFRPASRRLAFLEHSVLDRLITYAGAALQAERIGKIVSKAQRTQAQEALGDAVYTFALRRAPFLRETMPQVPDLPTTGELSADVRLSGYKLLNACFCSESKGFVKRLEQCFDPKLEWVFSFEQPSELAPSCWNFIYRLLIKDIAPSLEPVFR